VPKTIVLSLRSRRLQCKFAKVSERSDADVGLSKGRGRRHVEALSIDESLGQQTEKPISSCRQVLCARPAHISVSARALSSRECPFDERNDESPQPR
jgi:hypothetical protein